MPAVFYNSIAFGQQPQLKLDQLIEIIHTVFLKQSGCLILPCSGNLIVHEFFQFFGEFLAVTGQLCQILNHLSAMFLCAFFEDAVIKGLVGENFRHQPTLAGVGVIVVFFGFFPVEVTNKSQVGADAALTKDLAVQPDTRGAVYMANGAKMTLQDEEKVEDATEAPHAIIHDNTAANEGAGIYLAKGSTLYLSGAPDFGGTDTYAETDTIPAGSEAGDIKGVGGNFVLKDSSFKSGTEDPTNGGKTYPKDGSNYKVRQDIFIEGTDNPIKSVVVNGGLTSDPGTIWVWAEHQNHYMNDKQFAVVADDYTPTADTLETMLKVFRNAQPDATTENPNSEMYLYGVAGEGENIIWGTDATGSRKVILRKVAKDSYASLGGATFNMYKGNSESIFVLKDKAAGTQTTMNTDTLKSYDSGVFWVGNLPYGVYYLYEEAAPTKENGTGTTAYSNNAGKWFYLVVGDDVVMSMGYADRDAAKAGYESYKSGSDTTP